MTDPAEPPEEDMPGSAMLGGRGGEGSDHRPDRGESWAAAAALVGLLAFAAVPILAVLGLWGVAAWVRGAVLLVTVTGTVIALWWSARRERSARSAPWNQP